MRYHTMLQSTSLGSNMGLNDSLSESCPVQKHKKGMSPIDICSAV